MCLVAKRKGMVINMKKSYKTRRLKKVNPKKANRLEKNPTYKAEPIMINGKAVKANRNKSSHSTDKEEKGKKNEQSKNCTMIYSTKKEYRKAKRKELKRNLYNKRIYIADLIKRKWKKYIAWEKRNGVPLKFRIFAIVVIILLIWLWGLTAQISGQLQRGILLLNIEYNFFYCFASIFTNGLKSLLCGSIADTVVLMLLSFWYYRNHIHKRQTIPIERNGMIINVVIDDGSLATGHEATRDDLEKCFTLTTEPEKFDRPIYGIFEETGEYILGPEIKRADENRNELIVGAAGSGKSTSNIVPKIIKFAKRGENMIITDPSTELFKFTYLFLTNLGYTVEVINTRDPYASNGWNPVADAGDDFHQIQTIADTIINTAIKEIKDPFWPKQQANLLAALMGYSNYKYGKDSNIKIITSLVSDKGSTPEKLKKMIEATLPQFHPARRCFNNFWNSDTLRGRILNNLGTSLNIFYDPAIAEMLSTDDIKIKDFGYCEKKAIFIITAEADLTYSMIPGLFLDMCFKQLSDYTIENNVPTLHRPLHFICDEFANIGEIQDIGQKISVARKYGLILHVVIQNTSRFLEVYNEYILNTLIGNCWAVMVLGVKEDKDAKYFESMFGDMSVEYSQGTTESPMTNSTASLRMTPQKRPIYFANEITGMGKEYAMLYTADTNVCKVKKVPYYYMREYLEFKADQGGKDEDTQFPITSYVGTVKRPKEYTKADSKTKKENKTENTKKDSFFDLDEDEDEYTREDIESMSDNTFDFESEGLFKEDEGNYKDNHENEIESKSQKNSKRKKSKNNSNEDKEKIQGLYKENCEPLFFDFDFAFNEDDENNEPSIQLSLEGFIKGENLEEVNKIPNIKQKIHWTPLLNNYMIYIEKDQVYQKVKFKEIKDFPDLNNRQVFVLSFNTSADFIKSKMPKEQIRAEGEIIDISATTHYLMDLIELPKKYYIDKWTMITNSNKFEKEISLGTIIKMPNKHITLVPHIALKTNS